MQTVKANHLLSFLEMLGYASQELAIEQPVDFSGDSLALPLSQKLPVLLSEVAGISVYAIGDAGPQEPSCPGDH
jgi:hypothetical protein